MKINAVMPFDHVENATEFLQPEAVSEIATLTERLGFYGCSVTDHPCPTGRWIDAGGHYAQDPFVMLSLIAAATRTLRLQTEILVLPYRNPFITARAVASLDVFSGGRVVLGLGAGYLKGEFRAMGADFSQRNEIMDEYIAAMKAAWGADEFTFQGTGYEALGNRILPRPIQRPHPPLLIGGNSKRAMRRAAELGDAWFPFLTDEQLSATARTAAMTGEDNVAEGVRYIKEHCEKIGREKPPEIALSALVAPGAKLSAEAILDRIGRLRAAGVQRGSIHIDGQNRAQWRDNAEWFASEVLARID
jgi:probable F420-dependent oxidoreductase